MVEIIMDIKTSKEKRIRSRYIVKDKLFSDVFYTLYDGFDAQESNAVCLEFLFAIGFPQFADFCIQALQSYLYQTLPNVFQLIDMEYDGEDLFLLYKNENVSLISLDLYLNKIQADPDSAEKAVQVIIKDFADYFQFRRKAPHVW